jgi:hypothetical protein
MVKSHCLSEPKTAPILPLQAAWLQGFGDIFGIVSHGVRYDFFPDESENGNNSNSYISGLLNAIGHPMPQPPNTPGYEKPVMLNNFVIVE